MPISKVEIFNCPKCGHIERKVRGDVITSIDFISPECPKCGSSMASSGTSYDNVVTELLKMIFGKIKS